MRGSTGEVAAGVGELHGPEIAGHLLEIGPWSTLVAMATSPGGDTPLPPAPVYLSICCRTDHRLTGDPILDGGAWHGTATLTYADAQSEGAEHASTWQHTENVVHTWQWDTKQWDPEGD